MSRHRRSYSHAVGILLLLLAMGFSPEVVLCVGNAGHRAIELVGRDCCPSKSSANLGLVGVSDRCTSKCTDIRLLPNAAVSKSGGDNLTGDHSTQSSAIVPASMASLTESAAAPVSPYRVAYRLSFPPPRERHTTVQLC